MPIKTIFSCLGNPGNAYKYTRHNAGFMFADFMLEQIKQLNDSLIFHKVNNAEIWEWEHNHGSSLIIKPQTYMNLSGQAVWPIVHKYKISFEKILVIHDELDFVPGIFKFKFDGGLAGHNGLKSIAQSLGTNKFSRLRLGIGRPTHDAVSDYVLKPFAPLECDLLQSLFPTLWAAISMFIIDGIEKTIANYNRN